MPELKASLLVVDDEPLVRTSLSQLFVADGHSVRSAAEGLSALAEIRRELPEILISDLNMPGMSGFELLSVVRCQFPEIQVIAMSGAYSGLEVPSGVFADAFFQKGAGTDSLLEILRSLPHPDRMAQQLQTVPPPVWVSEYLQNSAGEGYVNIECPECMRSFHKVLNGTIDPTSHANCLYCGSLIRYVVVQPEDRPPFQTFLLPLQRRHSTPTPTFQSMQKRVS
jgi:CheY-like chemotaxis protein